MADLDAMGLALAPSVLEVDARAMIELERRGLSLPTVFGARRYGNDALAKTPLFASLVASMKSDLRELDARPELGPPPMPNRPFDVRWLEDPRARFELIGAVLRLDRRFVDPKGCGEAR